MKPGYKTTEFWLTVLAGIVGFIVSSGVLESLAEAHWVVKVVGALTVLLTALGYTVTRGKIKAAESNERTAKALSDGGDNSDS